MSRNGGCALPYLVRHSFSQSLTQIYSSAHLLFPVRATYLTPLSHLPPPLRFPPANLISAENTILPILHTSGMYMLEQNPQGLFKGSRGCIQFVAFYLPHTHRYRSCFHLRDGVVSDPSSDHASTRVNAEITTVVKTVDVATKGFCPSHLFPCEQDNHAATSRLWCWLVCVCVRERESEGTCI